MRRVKRLLLWLGLPVVLAAGGWIGYQMMMGPAEGTIVNTPAESQTPAKREVQLEQFDGKYISFAHPDTYIQRQPRTTDNGNPNSLESYSFVMSGIVSKLLTINVINFPSGKLDDDASYHMRTLYPETYAIRQQTIQGEKVTVVLDTKEYQLAAFWQHGSGANGKLLTFALSSINMDTGTTDSEYQKMLESIRWR